MAVSAVASTIAAGGAVGSGSVGGGEAAASGTVVVGPVSVAVVTVASGTVGVTGGVSGAGVPSGVWAAAKATRTMMANIFIKRLWLSELPII